MKFFFYEVLNFIYLRIENNAIIKVGEAYAKSFKGID